MVALIVLVSILAVALLYFVYYGAKDRIEEYKLSHQKDDDWRQYKTTDPELSASLEDYFCADLESAKRGKRFTVYSCKNKNSYYCLYCPRRREVVHDGTHYYGSGINCKFYKENKK